MMRAALVLLLLSPGILLAQNNQGHDTRDTGHATHPDVSGRWTLTADVFRTPLHFPLELSQDGQQLTGKLAGAPLTGTLQGNSVHFVAKGEHGGRRESQGTLKDNVISGTLVFTDTEDPEPPHAVPFTARRVPARRPGPPQRHEFKPTTFYREFSATTAPVLRISPGDTVHTTTIDAGGEDEKGVRRVMGGNPQTGPFFVETAAPGDTLAVHLTRLKLNRDWAVSDDWVVDRGMGRELAVAMKDIGKSIRWHLDAQRGVATPDKPAEHLTQYSVPLRPMLGCVGVAPNSAEAAPETADSGYYGGNLDFNEVVEGATVYLPVSVPGALLYIGDAHAVQGDGELNGGALETSMDVEFTVDVIPAKRIRGPRVESATHIMTVGLAGSLDDAFRLATSSMMQWLMDDYKLTPSEVAQVLGTSAEYKVNEVADRNAGIVLKINKERLSRLTSTAK
jgi:amidase